MFLSEDRTEGDSGVLPPLPPSFQALCLLGGNSKDNERVLSTFTSSWYATNQAANTALLSITVIRIWLQVLPLTLMIYPILYSMKRFIAWATRQPTVVAFGIIFL